LFSIEKRLFNDETKQQIAASLSGSGIAHYFTLLRKRDKGKE
jgi:hypothetical protein